MNRTPEDLNTFLQTLSGSDIQPALLVRDPESVVGLRAWTDEDSGALLEWVSADAQDANTDLQCLNQNEVADLLRVSIPTIMQFLRRECHPIPHLRNGRNIRVSLFLLKEWLREESVLSSPSAAAGMHNVLPATVIGTRSRVSQNPAQR